MLYNSKSLKYFWHEVTCNLFSNLLIAIEIQLVPFIITTKRKGNLSSLKMPQALHAYDNAWYWNALYLFSTAQGSSPKYTSQILKTSHWT